MSNQAQSGDFGKLFRKYRLRSEIETLAEFGDLLADEGYIYETSLFTRWQKGDRMPKDREVLLAMLQVFAKRRGIEKIEEANEFIEAANQRRLSLDEAEDLSRYFKSGRMQTLPARPQLFVGKELLVKESTWELMQGHNIMFSGMPGCGKTYTSLVLAHQLKDFFCDGIYWYRADVKDARAVIDNILADLGYPLQGFASLEQKMKKLTELLKGRKVLLILDNLNEGVDEYLEVILKIPVTTMVTSIASSSRKDIKQYDVSVFTKVEYNTVCEKVLGKPFAELHEEELTRLGAALGHLPILVVLSLKQIYHKPKDFDEYLERVEEVGFPHAEYDGKSLNAVLDMVIQKIPAEYQKILTYCAVFEGGDFSAKLVAKICNLTQRELREELQGVMSYSLMEESVKERYRLHPVVRDYLKRRLTSREYVEVAKFMLGILSSFQIGSTPYIEYLKIEHSNLKKLLVRLHFFKESQKVVEIWEKIGNYIFNCGDWGFVLESHIAIEDAYRLTGNKIGLAYFFIEDLARLYFFQNRDQEMESLFKKIYQISEEIKDPTINALIIQKQGIISMFHDQNRQAIELLETSITVLKKTKNAKEPVIKSYSYLGQLYLRENMYKKASQYMQLALKEAIKLNNLGVLCFVYAYVGHLFLKQGDKAKAEDYFKQALKLSEKSSMIVAKAMAYEGLSLLYGQDTSSKKLAIKNMQKSEEIYKQLGVSYNRRIIH